MFDRVRNTPLDRMPGWCHIIWKINFRNPAHLHVHLYTSFPCFLAYLREHRVLWRWLLLDAQTEILTLAPNYFSKSYKKKYVKQYTWWSSNIPHQLNVTCRKDKDSGNALLKQYFQWHLKISKNGILLSLKWATYNH